MPNDDIALTSALPAGQGNGVPAKWKLVPIEPTKEMKEAAFGPIMEGGRGGPITADRIRQEAALSVYAKIIASAPPAPTPDAGSDLAGLANKAHRGLLGNEHFRVELRGTGGIAPECEDRLAAVTCAPVMPSTSWLIGRMANTSRGKDDNAAYLLLHAAKRLADLSHVVEVALASSASPPPAEDLAGQDEPVAWAYEWLDDQNSWNLAYAEERPKADGYTDLRNIRPLYAAPAPSRPADRMAIARLLLDLRDNLVAEEDLSGPWPEGATGHQLKDRIDHVLALRDAPRTGGDETQEDHR